MCACVCVLGRAATVARTLKHWTPSAAWLAAQPEGVSYFLAAPSGGGKSVGRTSVSLPLVKPWLAA